MTEAIYMRLEINAFELTHATLPIT